ncbi:hypothetical protein D3C79_879670 [compost metagenome]
MRFVCAEQVRGKGDGCTCRACPFRNGSGDFSRLPGLELDRDTGHRAERIAGREDRALDNVWAQIRNAFGSTTHRLQCTIAHGIEKTFAGVELAANILRDATGHFERLIE